MTDSRIEQFKKMAEADPDNELGHFSLGKAYMDAERYDEAAPSLRRVLELNPKFSKAYALLGFCEMKNERKAEAIEILRKGYVQAHDRGDLMARNEMGALLTGMGIEPPPVEAKPTGEQTPDTATGFPCKRCGGGPKLSEPPMRGELGQRIFESICANCWREWIAMGTKVINELRLDFRSTEAQDVYDIHMKEFLGLED